jgi:hypothetical protein
MRHSSKLDFLPRSSGSTSALGDMAQRPRRMWCEPRRSPGPTVESRMRQPPRWRKYLVSQRRLDRRQGPRGPSRETSLGCCGPVLMARKCRSWYCAKTTYGVASRLVVKFLKGLPPMNGSRVQVPPEFVAGNWCDAFSWGLVSSVKHLIHQFRARRPNQHPKATKPFLQRLRQLFIDV